MTPTLISLINQSARVTDADCVAMVHSLGVQLARDVAPIWGLVPALSFGVPSADVIMAPCTISDIPDVPGAAGHHSDDGEDGPYIKVFTFEGAPALRGAEAVSVTVSHEFLEVVGDYPANKWADCPDGSDVAFELCDPVEGDTYEIDGVSVSNFVYPAWFDPNAKAGEKFDFMGKLSAPFSMTDGGYMIKRTEPGNVDQVFGAHARLGHTAAVADGGIMIIFGKDYPGHRKADKIAKAKRRRGK